MDFVTFARAHGILIDYAPPVGVWARYPTEDHPRKKNGAVKYLGDVGFVQNHATMTEPATWFPETNNDIRIDARKVQLAKQRASDELRRNRQNAAMKAREIIGKSIPEPHAYLDSKGFPDAQILVYRPDDKTNYAVIPMYVGRELVGAQLIDRDGVKKFLFGQRCAGAEFVIGSSGIDVWCEGYATALSVQACLKRRCRIHVCFSASNLASIARSGFVIADNDASKAGEKAAKSTGLSYFMPPVLGQDFNDYERDVGRFKATVALLQTMKGIEG